MQKQLLFFILCSKLCHAQQKHTTVRGTVTDEIGLVINAHIINKSNNKGTFSNDQGNFSIYASLGDTLEISSVQHNKKVVFITKVVIANKLLNIQLQTKTNILEEVIVKKHQLSGNLISDVKQTPKDKKAERVENLVSGIKDLIKKYPTQPVSFYEKHSSRVPIVRLPNTFEGIGTSQPMGGGRLAREREQKKLLQRQIEFPDKLLKELTPNFFFVELKIPEEKYHHFIAYCGYRINIENLYHKKELFKLIDILRVESISYLKTLKPQE